MESIMLLINQSTILTAVCKVRALQIAGCVDDGNLGEEVEGVIVREMA